MLSTVERVLRDGRIELREPAADEDRLLEDFDAFQAQPRDERGKV